jgi:hypothetical protein
MTAEKAIVELAIAYEEIIGEPVGARVGWTRGGWRVLLYPSTSPYGDRMLEILDSTMEDALKQARRAVLALSRKERSK